MSLCFFWQNILAGIEIKCAEILGPQNITEVESLKVNDETQSGYLPQTSRKNRAFRPRLGWGGVFCAAGAEKESSREKRSEIFSVLCKSGASFINGSPNHSSLRVQVFLLWKAGQYSTPSRHSAVPARSSGVQRAGPPDPLYNQRRREIVAVINSLSYSLKPYFNSSIME